MKKVIACVLLMYCAYFQSARSQEAERLTLEECYRLATQNYPLVKQHGLIAKASAYSIENIHKGYLPQITIAGQATYQSAVTEIPLKLPGLPVLSKDQYRLYAEGNQMIYNGGHTRQQKALQQAHEKVEVLRLETDLYQLHDRINQLFFGVLIIDEQLRQNNLQAADIQLGLNKVEAAIRFGTALKSNGDVLQASLLRNAQRRIELLALRNAYLQMMSSFAGRQLSYKTTFVQPAPVAIDTTINRPELRLFDAQAGMLNVQDKLLKVKTLPRVNAFLQGGVGRPALNMLSNNFEPYYIGGLRLQWSPSVLYTLKKERAINEIGRMKLDVQKETFLFNTNLMLKQQIAERDKYTELLAADDKIIALQLKVKAASLAQLENGVINANDYLREVNAEDQARLNKIVHQVQRLMSQHNLQNISGTYQ